MSTVFFVASFVALLCAAFMVASSENSKSTLALKKADEAMKHCEAIDNEMLSLRGALTTTLESVVMYRNEHEKSAQKIEWLEMKANNTPRQSLPQKIELTQGKPLHVSLIYKEHKPLTEAQAKQKIIKNIKTKMEGLSQ